MQQITKEFLKGHNACKPGYQCYLKNGENLNTDELILKLKDVRPDWANWLLTRLFNKEQKIKYAIFAAELVLHIFENKYPSDKRPRRAIEATKKYLNNMTEENKNAYANAAYAAAAANAANAAYAAYAVAAAYYDDDAYVAAVAAVAADAKKGLYNKIIDFGLELLKADNGQD